MQSIDTDVQSLGGGGWSGIGGYGNNPLLWLITLGFLKGDGGLGGGGASTAGVASNAAKIDCLQVGQQSLSDQISANSQQGQFAAVNANLTNIADTIFRETQALSRQNAECCCETRREIQAVNTSIALSTKDILKDNCDNTNRIINAINDQTAQMTQTKISELNQELAVFKTAAAVGHRPK